MKRVALAFALALTISTPIVVSGCQQFGTVTSQDMATAEKSLTVAHLAYNAIGKTILNLTQTGVLKGQTAAQVKVYYDKAGDALLAADQADKAANATSLNVAIANANDAITSIQNLIKGFSQ